jgi:hypothetical protein
MRNIYISLLTAMTISVPLFAQKSDEVNESDLFSNPDSVVETKKLDKKAVAAEDNMKKIGISGELNSVNMYSYRRGSVSDKTIDGNQFNPYIDGTLLADVRLPAQSKGFGNFEGIHNAQDNTNNFYMRELFLDFNIGNVVYFRTGKQVLQWGRCYLWNPTDLINVEKKSFQTKIGSREGAYGLKAQISFGTAVNMYGFADTSKADNINQIAGAYKLEFLIGTTEMAFSVWGKDTFHPVYGYDFSTRLLTLDIVGEASASYGSNTEKVIIQNGILTTDKDEGKWIPKASINIGRSFDWFDQLDKISIHTEFFYNGDGYKKNFLNDDTLYIHNDTVTLDYNGAQTVFPGGSPMNKAYYLLAKNLYEPNYHSRYYAALFTTINKFIISDLTLSLNAIGNLEHKSFIAATDLEYQDINDFKAGIIVNTYIGKKNTEYTFKNQRGDITVKAGIIY